MKMNAAMRAAMTASPPMTPPAIAPLLTVEDAPERSEPDVGLVAPIPPLEAEVGTVLVLVWLV